MGRPMNRYGYSGYEEKPSEPKKPRITKDPGQYQHENVPDRIPLATPQLFSHPDYTVGSGITPDRPPSRWFADSTAGRESHPAPKTIMFTSQLL